jgi:uncharacterized protein
MRFKCSTFAFAMVIAVGGPFSKSAELSEQAPSTAEVRALLQVNGAADLGESVGSAVAQQIVLNLRQANPALPTRADAVVTDAVVAYVQKMAAQDQFVEKLIPIYAKYLTKQDVLGLTAFYRSPLGHKLASVSPGISIESARLGQQWMASILPGLQAQVFDKLKSEKLLQ